MWQCLVVDDDDFARAVVKHFVERTPELELAAESEDAVGAAAVLRDQKIDIVFLDVEMPEMSGIELVRTLENLPEVVLITSRENYAVEAFEHKVTDYLIKPVRYSRFLKAVRRAEENIEQKRSAPAAETEKTPEPPAKKEAVKSFFIKSEGKIIKIPADDICYIEALSDYVILHTLDKQHIMHATMKGIMEKLSDNFIRIHRSHIVNLDKIDSVEDAKVISCGKSMPVSASYKTALFERLNFLM